MSSLLLPYIERPPAAQGSWNRWGDGRGRAVVTDDYACPSAGGDGWRNQGGTVHDGGVDVLFSDGSVRFVEAKCDWIARYSALGTRRGGKPVFPSAAAAVSRFPLATARVSVPAGETRVVGTPMSRRVQRILEKQRVRRLRIEATYTITSPVGDEITATRTFKVKLRRRRG